MPGGIEIFQNPNTVYQPGAGTKRLHTPFLSYRLSVVSWQPNLDSFES